MAILLTIVLGAFVGFLASLVLNKNTSMGWFENIVVGIIGAGVGKFILSLFDGRGVNFAIVNLGDTLVAFLGAVVLLGLVNLATRGRIQG